MMKFFSLQIEVFSPTNRKELLLALFGVLVSAGIIALLSVNRSFFTYGVETDYLGGFIKDAHRFSNGEPLRLIFHPPFYSITLSLIQSIVHDWFATGLFLSWFSSMIVLCTSFIFFYQLFGSYAAWGSLLGMLTSTIFISYSAQATSDLFYLATYISCFFLSLQAIRSHSNKYWAITGLVLGFSLLTRSNSLTLLILITLPWFQSLSLHSRSKNFLWLVSGLLIPLLAWIVIATLTNSAFVPTKSHLNLALRYFRPDTLKFKWSGDVMLYLDDKFKNTLQVLTYDPVNILKIYVKDLVRMPLRIFSSNGLLSFPLNFIALPGFLLLFFHSRKFYIFLFLVATLSQICLVNLSPFKFRTLLFLVPILGAGVGLFIDKILMGLTFQKARFVIWLFLIPFLVYSINNSYRSVYESLHSQDKEFEEVIPELKKRLTHDSFLVVRKPHIPYYVNCQSIKIPLVQSTDELKEALNAEFSGYPIYFYYGWAEQRSRPELIDLKFPDKSPKWLEPIAKSQIPGNWILYRFIPTS